MLRMPTRTGYMIEWETGEMSRINKNRPLKESLCTTSYEIALKIKNEKEGDGFKNVKIYECIF